MKRATKSQRDAGREGSEKGRVMEIDEGCKNNIKKKKDEGENRKGGA